MSLEQHTSIPDKLFFNIAEVAELAGVKAHVLRYWETQFSLLSPGKSSGNRRLYRKQDVESVLLIKELLYKKRFSIEGARKYILSLKKNGDLKKALVSRISLDEKQVVALNEAADELRAVLALCE